MSEAVSHLAPQFARPEQQAYAAHLGMWIFLATEVMFFGPLFFAYCYGRFEYPDGFAAASRQTAVLLGTLNTAVLLTSSLCMALAAAARRADARHLAAKLLWCTAALGIAFLAIKGYEYAKDWHEQLVPAVRFSFAAAHRNAAELFFFLYFAMTGLHALHLTIGIILVVVLARTLQGRSARLASTEHLEVSGLYWHFVDAIWIFLYPIIYLVGRSA
jgi:cytochrome c oxidase subunit III